MMNDYFCLAFEELEQAIDHFLDGTSIVDSELRTRIELSVAYCIALGGLSYLLTRIIDRRQKRAHFPTDFVDLVYKVSDRARFDVEEFDAEFVDYLVRSPRNESLSIEEDLVDIQNRLRSHRYVYNYRF